MTLEGTGWWWWCLQIELMLFPVKQGKTREAVEVKMLGEQVSRIRTKLI